eukprot:g5491.t1
MASTPKKEKDTEFGKMRPAGLSSGSLAYLTRENFRQTSPVHVRRSSLGSSSNTPEKSLYNKLHEDPKVKAAQYSGYNRRVLQTSAIAFGDEKDPTLSSEKGRSWNRVRAAVPGTSSFRFFHENQNATQSKVHKKSERKKTFKSAISETANLDGQKMRYVLPSSREPSQIHKEQMMEEKIKWTDANQNIRLLRYDYPLAVGKRHIKNDVYDSTGVQEHLNYVTGNSSQSNGDICMASKARRQRNLRCSSNIFSAPEYPTSSKEIIPEKITCVSPIKLSKSAREMRKQPAAGIKAIGDDY